MFNMLTAPNDMFCAGCGKKIKLGQKISLDGLCYVCKRKQTKRFKGFSDDIGDRLRKPKL